MDLICPSCGSGEIVYSGTSTAGTGGYEATDARYTCKKCGYTGPLVIDAEVEAEVPEHKKDFPYAIVLIIGFISFAAYGMRTDLVVSALFFIIPTSLLLFFYFFIKSEDFGGVEKDLQNLNEEGEPRESSARIK